MNATLITTVVVGNTLGEGVLWDERGKRVWWTDIQERRLFRFQPGSGVLQTFDLPHRLGSFGFVEGSDRIIGAFECGFAFFHPETSQIEWLARPVHDGANVRFNDGRVDRQGRFWAGSMVEGEGNPSGKLYCLAQGRLEVQRTGVKICNSLCFSQDGHWMYFADSPHRTILRFEIDPGSGSLSNPSVFARTAAGAYPDGSTIDAQGHLWNAQWGAGRVVRYGPDGCISGQIDLPVTQPTCVAFGGENLDLLFVTTARENLTPECLTQQPCAGDLFVYDVGVTGCLEARYRMR